MKAHNKLFLSLAIGTLLSFAGCQEDEVVELVGYPVNQPAMTIDGAEGASEAKLTAVYKADGTLTLSGPVTRTYTFRLVASPKDATVTFDVINVDIPKENIEISATQVVLPAGSTDASVTVTLKEEDFGFAASNYEAATYALGVKARVEGYKIGTESLESRVVIEKEAYTASCFVVRENGKSASFERTYSQGSIVNTEPIFDTFKVKLDKPARKEVKVKMVTTGLDEKFMSHITVLPEEITIPAGELESAEITWAITDEFLLTTVEPETHTLVVTASVESEDPVVVENTKENFLTFTVNKVFRNFGYVAEKATDWVELAKTGWSVEVAPRVSGNGNNVIDGSDGDNGTDIYKAGGFWFVVDMKAEKTLTGVGADYYKNSGSASSPRKVILSTSLDNVTWVKQGTVDTPQSYTHYFRFFAPQKARYVKFELEGPYNGYIDVTEIYLYNAQ